MLNNLETILEKTPWLASENRKIFFFFSIFCNTSVQMLKQCNFGSSNDIKYPIPLPPPLSSFPFPSLSSPSSAVVILFAFLWISYSLFTVKYICPHMFCKAFWSSVISFGTHNLWGSSSPCQHPRLYVTWREPNDLILVDAVIISGDIAYLHTSLFSLYQCNPCHWIRRSFSRNICVHLKYTSG